MNDRPDPPESLAIGQRNRPLGQSAKSPPDGSKSTQLLAPPVGMNASSLPLARSQRPNPSGIAAASNRLSGSTDGDAYVVASGLFERNIVRYSRPSATCQMPSLLSSVAPAKRRSPGLKRRTWAIGRVVNNL